MIKKFLLFLVNFLACLFLLFWGFLGGYFFRMLAARLYDKYEYYIYSKEFEKTPYGQFLAQRKKDYYGGITPQETWTKFLKLISEENFEIAARYFWAKDEEELKHIAEYLKDNKDIILAYPQKIVLEYEPNFGTIFDTDEYRYITVTYYNDRFYAARLKFSKNPYTGVWKMSPYYEIVQEYPSIEEKYKTDARYFVKRKERGEIDESTYLKELEQVKEDIQKYYIPEYLKVKKVYELINKK